MSINNATAADWDRLRKQTPAIEPTIKEPLMQVYLDMADEEFDKTQRETEWWKQQLARAERLEYEALWGKEDAACLNFDSSAYKFEEENSIDGAMAKSHYWANSKELLEPCPVEEEYKEDVVNNPNHYNNGSIECIEGIQAAMSAEAFNGYLKGNCMKYLWRYDYKGKPLEDLQKARWYLAALIKELLFEEEEDDDYNEEEHYSCLSFPFCYIEGCGGGE